jgi:ATPase family associated with various cellular activities (AAA)
MNYPNFEQTMTKFTNNSNNYYPFDTSKAATHLPIGCYTVGYNNDLSCYYLIPDSNRPKLPSKIYGKDHEKQATKFVNYWIKNTNKSTGVLLVGEPGSGKTLLTMDMMLRTMAMGKSVIVVDKPFYDAKFKRFLHEELNQLSCMVVFDEFEKMYPMTSDDEVNAGLLCLFDGTSTSHKLFVCTANNKHDISTAFFNRTGRFRYLVEFGSVDKDAVTEYVNEKCTVSTLVSPLIKKLHGFTNLNFDCLTAIVEEVNECLDIEEAMRFLNIKNDIPINMFMTKCTDEHGVIIEAEHHGKYFDYRHDYVYTPDNEKYYVDSTIPYSIIDDQFCFVATTDDLEKIIYVYAKVIPDNLF